MWGRGGRKCRFFFRMCLSLYDYQSKASRYRNVLIYLKNKVTTNQKHTKDSQKSKRTQAYYKIKKNKNPACCN